MIPQVKIIYGALRIVSIEASAGKKHRQEELLAIAANCALRLDALWPPFHTISYLCANLLFGGAGFAFGVALLRGADVTHSMTIAAAGFLSLCIGYLAEKRWIKKVMDGVEKDNDERQPD